MLMYHVYTYLFILYMIYNIYNFIACFMKFYIYITPAESGILKQQQLE